VNYLALVQRLRQEVNYSNTGPTAVTSQTGDHARAVSWIADAYTELQNRHSWRWLRNDFILTATSAVSTYASSAINDATTGSAITRFNAWHIDDPYNPPRCYLSSSGSDTEYPLTYIDWEAYRYIYELGNQTDASPTHITVDPADNIRLGPAPAGTYVITSEYHKSPQVLAANTETPEMPTQFHMLIVYLAMEDSGFFDAAEEVIGRGVKKGRKLMRQLEVNQGPKIRMAGALV